MQVRLLGPVDVVANGTTHQVSGTRRKALLAALALSARRVVSTDRLIDIIWGDDAPAKAVNSLQSHVSYLRGVLGDRSAIRGHPPGYVLDLDGEATDADTAQRLIDEGLRSADPACRMDKLRAAVALWRGPALSDLAGLPWFDEQAQRLRQLLLRARQALVECRLALGEHDQVIVQLEALCREYPLHEQLHGLLMLALYRAGRQADALAAYRDLRRGLNDELGIDPGRALRDLELAILRQDAVLDSRVAATGIGPVPVRPAVPRQLPPAVASLAGRRSELARLDGLLAGANGGGPPKPVVIAALAGTAGVGKTALAVYWARQVADRFPDGQLYVDLRGFDPGGSVLDPSDAVRLFLDAFGVPAERIPARLDAQTALYRSLLAGRRVLVVLDNARDVEQVRPLLPGGPGCFAVVTSRNQLTGLVAGEGAHPLSLDLLTPDEARDLLSLRLNGRRVESDPAATDVVIARCAGLPLALSIFAARAATYPSFPLAALAAELRDAAGALQALGSEDAATDVRAVFSWSYRTLSPDAARLFDLLGLHPGPDVSAAAAASLAGVPARRVRALLGELTRAHLLTERVPGRYTFHDLLRAYASELAQQCEGPADRRAATHRMLDHYLHTAHAAALMQFPHREPLDLAPPQPGVVPEPITGKDGALAWYAAEYRVLLASIERAAAERFDAHPWQLAWALRNYLSWQGRFDVQVAIERTAFEAARRVGDTGGQARALAGLGLGLSRSGRLDDADAHLRQALALFTELGDLTRQAFTHWGLAGVASARSRPADALAHNRQSLDLYRRAGNEDGQAVALNGIGRSHALLRDYGKALTFCRQSLVMHEKLGDLDGQAAAWDSLGDAHFGLADYPRAIDCYGHAIDLYRHRGVRHWEAQSAVRLGDAHDAAGNRDAARAAWQRAVDIFDELDHPDAEQVRDKLGSENHTSRGLASRPVTLT
jgi:DNA-binding SARP family transcriptional activator